MDDASLAGVAGGEEGGWKLWNSWSRRTGGVEECERSSRASCWCPEWELVQQHCAPCPGSGGAGGLAAGCSSDGGGQTHPTSTSYPKWQSQGLEHQRLGSLPYCWTCAVGMMVLLGLEMQGQMWCCG